MHFDNVKIEFEMKSDFFIEHIWKCQSDLTLIFIMNRAYFE